jgi:hypothetical protein
VLQYLAMSVGRGNERERVGDEPSTAERRRRCAVRLDQLGVRPGISRRRLIRLLERQEGRPIRVVHDGENGHLRGYSAGVSASVDRLTHADRIVITVADPLRSERAKHAEAHEWAHLILDPGSRELLSTSVQAGPDAPSGMHYKCNVSDEVEREVEITAYLLQRYMDMPLILESMPAQSELGSVLARRVGGLDPL